MSLTIRLTGTGGAQLVPVFGCDCAACRRAALMRPTAAAPAARR
ncbi:carbon-phosphorus lyase complex accessory protein [Raoultella terrigena]|uniref:Carbon-phosphorus lyase complex accessory protein n=1 Tax=Raoultella terrigena TaxID=577 RepID=A0A485AVN4_RAOTE|nr:carbon-phosphorus lyase complex accessory protein [Raoultella terrigena]